MFEKMSCVIIASLNILLEFNKSHIEEIIYIYKSVELVLENNEKKPSDIFLFAFFFYLNFKLHNKITLDSFQKALTQ